MFTSLLHGLVRNIPKDLCGSMHSNHTEMVVLSDTMFDYFVVIVQSESSVDTISLFDNNNFFELSVCPISSSVILTSLCERLLVPSSPLPMIEKNGVLPNGLCQDHLRRCSTLEWNLESD
ncbi:hypothetical protein L3Y34_008513 [Caenorhabditis briggsae]|uniref:Uncharacterized protein n=1 Tax=Caenorhabditis briggsae TaxID=6238 RepID=A0AAE9A5T2_CAEBR|nr:hypothetical protein L3Y34_008513 [Caenorhabditis briggsae]